MSTRVLICDELAPVAGAVFAERGLEVETRTGLSEDGLVEVAGGFEALVVRSATRITRRVVEAAPRLRVVGRAGTGVDNVDVDAATERGVVVMNVPGGNTTTTAEHALALLCALSRQVARADRAVRAGRWKERGRLMGVELTGKTLGILGLGRIGRALAERARGLSMKVVAYDPYLQVAGEGPVDGIELVDLERLLARSDFVSVHVPLGDATRNLLSRERLFAMKPGARLINAARGGLVDEAALVEALESGHLAGAALDVLAEEPPPADHPLLARDDVLLTPHLGASSHEAQENVAEGIARQICDYLEGGPAFNAVNAPAVSAPELAAIGPYARLAEKMALFLAQRLGGPARKVELSLAGEIAGGRSEYLRLAVLVGLLHDVDPGVNFVNAPLFAKERGVRVLVGSDDEPHFYTSQIKLRVSSKGAGTSRVAVGTVFGRRPRIVRVDDVHLDLDPQGPILITRHRDRPGVVGLIGTLLGQHGVNIRRVELGPPTTDGAPREQGLASGFFSLYDEPGPELLAAVRALEPIESLELVHL